jgi:hypothetical protein
MSVYQKPNSPFLFDSVTGHICGIKQEDGSETFFMLSSGAVGTPINGVQATLTSDMTNENADITLTAVDFGAGGNSISVVYINPGAEAALSVTVAGNAITVNLASSADPAITSTAAQVVEAINEHAEASLLVLATYEGSGAGVVNAKSVASLTGGVTVTPGEIGSMRHKADGSVLYRKISAQVWKSVAMS